MLESCLGVETLEMMLARSDLKWVHLCLFGLSRVLLVEE